MATTDYDLPGAIIDYENGSLDSTGIVRLFQYLVDTGMVWTMQGTYGRVAQKLIDEGLVTAKRRNHGKNR